jgi:hypothetical protein
MAVVQYSNVYRSGASSGSPVTSIYVCDTTAELPTTGTPGDIALTKDTGIFYVYNQNWFQLMRSDAKWPFTGDVNIKKAFPILYFSATDAPTANQKIFRLTNYQGDMYIQPCDDAGNFQHEALKITRQGDVVVAGGIFEASRTVKLGYIIDVPFSSGDFVCDRGTFTIVDYTRYSYSLVGNTMTVFYNFHGTLAGSPTQIYIRIPAGATSQGNFQNTNIMYDLDGKSWRAGKAYTNLGWGSFVVIKIDFAAFANGDFYAIGQFSFALN